LFHVHDECDIPDGDGVDLSDPKAVRDEAIRAADEMLRDLAGAFTGEE
jgi:hypothetical protein